MDSLSLQEVTENLDTLINQVTESHQPIIIKGTHNDVVIIAKEDWSTIEETIYLNSIPGYVKSIHEAISSPREEWVNVQELGL